jgi:predicted amidohydrolase
VAAPWGEIAGKLGCAEGTLVVDTDFARLDDWKKIAPTGMTPSRLYSTIMDFDTLC